MQYPGQFPAVRIKIIADEIEAAVISFDLEVPVTGCKPPVDNIDHFYPPGGYRQNFVGKMGVLRLKKRLFIGNN